MPRRQRVYRGQQLQGITSNLLVLRGRVKQGQMTSQRRPPLRRTISHWTVAAVIGHHYGISRQPPLLPQVARSCQFANGNPSSRPPYPHHNGLTHQILSPSQTMIAPNPTQSRLSLTHLPPLASFARRSRPSPHPWAVVWRSSFPLSPL